MSDGNNDPQILDQHQHQHRPTTITPGRILGVRSASPAKRSAADMEGSSGQHVPGSFVKDPNEEEVSHFDEVMSSALLNAPTHTDDGAADTQETTTNSASTSAQASLVTDTSTTSFESDVPPPYSASDSQRLSQQNSHVPPIDEQVRIVYRLVQEDEPDEGKSGYIVSNKWIFRVWARSSEGLNDTKFPKEAREGEIGPVDNSDIVPEGAFREPVLKDTANQWFIPIKHNLSLDEDYQILPYQAWGLIVSWYGNTLHQKPIVRYVHNTAPPEAVRPNFQYELRPPVITIRKIPQPHDDEDEKEESSTVPKSALLELHLKGERRARGQLLEDDAIQLVSSKSERFNTFLKRAKHAAGIAAEHKVKIWKLADQTKITTIELDTTQNGTLSPPDSRAASPKGARAPESKLILDLDTWSKMEGGKDFWLIDAKDETNNSNYNGKAIMAVYELYEDSTIALEEMIGGPAGGEFPSDSKKLAAKLGPSRKILGSKPGSANVSGRTSPAPPASGIMTRGRTRRDGRTRGTVGLTNLGNTCYMNSALQCIRSVEELALYFLSGKFKSEINGNNPLGHGGAMAKRYSELLQSIYAENASGAITPTAFRKTLGSIQPMFSGYGQQDSQEFLSFLVDALHEDLNRIIKKPYNENPDSDDKTVHDPEAIIKLGEVYRANHRARNDSVAMDLFSGFYKNTMECPVCDKISITFDPYSLLTVQLPIESTFQHDVTYVPLRGKPVNHVIDIDKNASVKMLKEYVASKHPGAKADRLWMAEVYSHKIYKVFDDATTLGEASIQLNDNIFIFELDAAPTNPPAPAEKRSMYSFSNNNRSDLVPDMDDPKANQFVVPVFSRQRTRHGYSWEIILHPMYITVTREQAQNYETILKKVLIAISRLTSRPILTELGSGGERDSASSNVEMKDESAGEDNAQISEHSVSSEDGYVEVSLDKLEDSPASGNQVNGVVEGKIEEDDRPVPKHFMDPQYFISPDLRTSLFTVNYGQSENGGLHCSGMQSFKDNTVHEMAERVKAPVRRSSMQTSSSGEESTTSTGSGARVNGIESDESDVDDMDKPDITLSEQQESYLGVPTPTAELSDDELPDNPLDVPISRKGRRKNNKHGKKNRKLKTYSKKGQRGHRQKDSAGSFGAFQSPRGFGSKSLDQDDNPYYIKLGEAIILNWVPQAVDQLFGGEPNDRDDERGHFASSADGKHLPYLQDPEVEAKRARRELRKKNGITLDDCFVETGKREVLSEDNAWYCSRCKELRRARKTLEIWTIPDILVVHMKRFGGNRSFRDKIDVLVDYPIEGLDMTDRVGLKEDGKEYIYDLFAVDNHYGGLGGGHYTALAKNFYDGHWYDYNDSSCNKVTGENRLHSAAAYLLFYRRRSERPLGPQYLQDLVLEARNPPSAAEDAGEESESGEGMLDGPTSSLRGSSSKSVGAGVDPASLHNAGNGLAGNSLTTRTTSPHEQAMELYRGAQPVYGPQKPPHLEFGNQGSTWSWNNLDDDAADANDAAKALMINVDDSAQDDDDAASTTAMLDGSEQPFEDHMVRDLNDFEDHPMSTWSAQAGPTPAGSDDDSQPDFQDHHGMYSSAHDPYHDDADLDTLHLEDAGTTGNEMDQDPEPVNIYPETLPPIEHD